MRLIDGKDVMQGPAPVVTMSPEHEQDAAAKLARTMEARGKRKAEQAAGITETTTTAPEVIETEGDAPELSEAVGQSSSDHDSPG